MSSRIRKCPAKSFKTANIMSDVFKKFFIYTEFSLCYNHKIHIVFSSFFRLFRLRGILCSNGRRMGFLRAGTGKEKVRLDTTAYFKCRSFLATLYSVMMMMIINPNGRPYLLNQTEISV